MSRHQEIFKLVEGLIKDHKGSEYEVTLDLDLRKDLEVDSVDLMEYIIYLDYVLKKTSK